MRGISLNSCAIYFFVVEELPLGFAILVPRNTRNTRATWVCEVVPALLFPLIRLLPTGEPAHA